MEYTKIECGYRIHANSIDMNAYETGRCCGGIGFTLENPSLQITAFKSNKSSINSRYPEKVERLIDLIIKKYQLQNKHYTIEISNEISQHIGLGSSTQLVLALGRLILELNKINFDIEDYCRRLNVAGVSGIGLGAFLHGGFIVDGGYNFGKNKDKNDLGEDSHRPPKILANYSFPSDWKAVLVIPNKQVQLTELEEEEFFRKCTPVNIKDTREISYYILMHLMPSILEVDFSLFINSLKEITRYGTKPYEIELNQSISKPIINKLQNIFGFASMSSLGPSCYSFYDSNKISVSREQLTKTFPDCEVIVSSVRNYGSKVTVASKPMNKSIDILSVPYFACGDGANKT